MTKVERELLMELAMATGVMCIRQGLSEEAASLFRIIDKAKNEKLLSA